ncbi:hypothetical protein [Methanosphaera sp. WGK6]|uniref:hypothetical protein n=1 Tax=Methanosphaera sp. WGK6 TaxID=1561964 RepID=UPI00084C3BCD|nr:hypothetical protein [Methanosphaera sp. WGK6]OED29844.1 hypothetical protein NL43_06030 [Methanosphaera sp. WGK6]
MDDRLEKIFTNFANDQADALKEMGMTKEEFVENAKEWSKTEEGKLEIQKFILNQEIKSIEDEINELKDKITKKLNSIGEIDEELSKL